MVHPPGTDTTGSCDFKTESDKIEIARIFPAQNKMHSCSEYVQTILGDKTKTSVRLRDRPFVMKAKIDSL